MQLISSLSIWAAHSVVSWIGVLIRCDFTTVVCVVIATWTERDISPPSSQQIYNCVQYRCWSTTAQGLLLSQLHSCSSTDEDAGKEVIYNSFLYVCAPTCKHNHCCNFGTEWNMCTSPESVPTQNENPIHKGLMCMYVDGALILLSRIHIDSLSLGRIHAPCPQRLVYIIYTSAGVGYLLFKFFINNQIVGYY